MDAKAAQTTSHAWRPSFIPEASVRHLEQTPPRPSPSETSGLACERRRARPDVDGASVRQLHPGDRARGHHRAQLETTTLDAPRRFDPAVWRVVHGLRPGDPAAGPRTNREPAVARSV